MKCEITIVRVKGGWAQKAVMNGKARYRRYHYQKDAEKGLKEWKLYPDMSRNFGHNFSSSAELGLPFTEGDSTEKSW